MKRPFAIFFTSLSLFLLWTYTVYSKISDFKHFKAQMRKQVFSQNIIEALVYVLPASEIIAAALLCYAATRVYGFLFSALLLLAFSIYIALILTNVFGRVPCSCGGILEKLGWTEHLLFNLVFFSLSIVGFVLELNHLRERR